MLGLMLLIGVVGGTMALVALGALIACGKLLGFMLDLWISDPDLHRKKDDVKK